MLSIEKDPHKIRNYFLVLIVFLSVVCPFFTGTKARVVIPFVILGYFFILKGHKIDRKVVILSLIVVFLILLQGLFWGFRLLTVFTYTAFSIILPYFLFRIVGIKFFRYLVNIIFISAVYTTIIWALQNLDPEFNKYLQQLKDYVFIHFSFDRWARSLIFYTVSITKANLNFIEIYRNYGLYGEPGAFAYWLIIGIGLNTIINKKPLDKKNLLMTLALLTTFSTAGYIQLFVLLSFLIFKSHLKKVAKVLIIGFFILSSFYIYTKAPFMEEKISSHKSEQFNVELKGTYTSGRFIRLRKAFNIIMQSPIIGRGIITASQEDNPYSAYNLNGAASINIIVRFGLFFGAIYYLFFYRGIKTIILAHNYYKSFALFFLAAITLGGFAQPMFHDNLTIQFFFTGLLLWNKKIYLSKKGVKKYHSQV
jgi:hypothetical protein